MGHCISIPNKVIPISHININIIINSVIYPLYASQTNMTKWYIYIPPYIKKEINKSANFKIDIGYTYNGLIYDCEFILDNKYERPKGTNKLITKNSKYFKMDIIYGPTYLSQIIIQFDK